MLQQLLKEVARGQRGARDLTYVEALEAAEAILAGNASPAQIGAFLIAERIKMESVEELLGFTTAARRQTRRSQVVQGLDCAGPYDGRKKSFYATFAASFVLAAEGLPVVLHGSDSLPPKWGITLSDMLRVKGISLADIPAEALESAARQSGILFAPSEVWCPPLAMLRDIRIELGMRTVWNTVEKLLDVSMSPYLVFGVFHNTVFERMAKLLTGLGYKRSLIVQGVEGSEDLHLDRPTRIYLVENGEAEKLTIDPETFGLEQRLEPIDWTPELQIDTVELVLSGNAAPSFTNQVILNSALRLWLTERADSMDDGIALSQAALKSGAALEKYRQVIGLLT